MQLLGKKTNQFLTIDIRLTYEEAETLAILCYSAIGGNPQDSRRKHTDRLLRLLESAGVKYPPVCTGMFTKERGGGSFVEFRDEPGIE